MDVTGASAAASLDEAFSKPWRSFCCDSFSGHIKLITTPTSVRIMVTDFMCLYQEILEEDVLQGRCKDLNPSIEVVTESLVRQLSQGLSAAIDGSSKNSPELTAVVDSASLEISLNMSIGEVRFRWTFRMTALGSDQFYSHVTLPMLVMLAALQEQRERLFALLSKKDAEISDLNASGARLSKKNLRTSPFDEDGFMEDTELTEVLKKRFSSLHINAFSGAEVEKIMKVYQDVSASSQQKSRDCEIILLEAENPAAEAPRQVLL
ncbi:non-homologous end-joining factor 1-like isoform X2 [Amblyomma americanum]